MSAATPERMRALKAAGHIHEWETGYMGETFGWFCPECDTFTRKKPKEA